MRFFGVKLTQSQISLLRKLARQVVSDLHDLGLRAHSRQRDIAKHLLRELALEHGVEAPLVLIDVAIESSIRSQGLHFR